MEQNRDRENRGYFYNKWLSQQHIQDPRQQVQRMLLKIHFSSYMKNTAVRKSGGNQANEEMEEEFD